MTNRTQAKWSLRVILALMPAMTACGEVVDPSGAGGPESAAPDVETAIYFARPGCPLIGTHTTISYESHRDGQRTVHMQLHDDQGQRLADPACQGVRPLASSVSLSYRIPS